MPRNFAITNPMFQYAMRVVNAITNAQQAQITTTFNHGFISGLQVRITLPNLWGMRQINGKSGTINVTSPTTFTVDIDTSGYDAFVTPLAALQDQAPQVVPISGLTANISGVNNLVA